MSSHRRPFAMALVAVVALVATAVPAHAATKPKKWGAAFCGALTEWATTITDGANDLQIAAAGAVISPTQGKALLVTYLGDAEDATDEFGESLRDAGVPDVAKGARITSTILEGIAGVKALLGSFATQASQLPTTDALTFQNAARPLVAQLEDVSQPFEDAMDEVSELDRKNALGKSLKKVKACRDL
jgi:hypothetical protein